MKQRFFALCVLCALAVCCLAGVRLLGAPETPSAVPSPSGTPDDRPTLALFGDGTDAWSREVLDGLGRWAGEQGWELIAYDCNGSATAQQGQVENLARMEKADAAVLCPVGDAEQLAGWVETLGRAEVPVVVLSRRSVGDAPGAASLVCPEDGEPFAAVAGYFQGRGGLLLLADLPDDPVVETAREALEANGARVLDYGACWGAEDYAKDYLTQALERFPQAGGVVAFSRAGALGAKAALGDRDTPVLCLEYGPAVEEDLALGRMDAAVEVSASDAIQALETCVPAVRSGEGEDAYPLDVHIRVPEA